MLNTTSRKKRNGMLIWTNTGADGGSVSVQQKDLVVNGATNSFFVWNATAMNLDSVSLLRNPATRTATTCYMRGLSERLRIQTNSGLPWFHRRICVTTKGPNAFNAASAEAGQSAPTQNYVDTSNGIERLFFNIAVNATPAALSAIRALLFKGQAGVDWDDPIIAPVDTTRVTLRFDKTWTLHSGNTSGIVKERKLWHPMNHNLVYDDDENGETEVSSYYSVDSKAGMGDYYVIDIINPGSGSTSTDLLLLRDNATLYWHEK